MKLKAYRLDRSDLLINTQWGIPEEQLSKKEAKSRNLKNMNSRWVTLEEKGQLRKEHLAYRRILNLSIFFLILIPGISLLYISGVGLSALVPLEWTTILTLLVSVLASGVSVTLGLGLRRFKNWARILATGILTTSLILATIAWLSADGRPRNLAEFPSGYAWIIGQMSIHIVLISYLNQWTSRKIFNPSIRPYEETEIAESSGVGYSFPYGVPLVIYPLLIWGTFTEYGNWFGILCQVFFFGFIGLFSYVMLSSERFNALRDKKISMNKITWVFNWGVFFVLLPLLVWVFFTITGRLE